LAQKGSFKEATMSMSYEEMVRPEKYVQLPNWEEMRRRLETIDDRYHFLREHFYPKMLELADHWVNAGFVASELKLIVDRICLTVRASGLYNDSQKLVPKLIDAVIDDWEVAFRTKLVFLESSRRVPSM
jgi:hypothetical protein